MEGNDNHHNAQTQVLHLYACFVMMPVSCLRKEDQDTRKNMQKSTKSSKSSQYHFEELWIFSQKGEKEKEEKEMGLNISGTKIRKKFNYP